MPFLLIYDTNNITTINHQKFQEHNPAFDGTEQMQHIETQEHTLDFVHRNTTPQNTTGTQVKIL